MKKLPIVGVIGVIQGGIPLVKEFISLFKKHPKTPEGLLVAMPQSELIEKVKQLEGEEKSFLVRLGNLILTAATVYGVIYASKQLGVTYETIISLFGIIK